MALHPHSKPRSPSSAAAGQSDLTRLLETEARLEEILRRAREEAARLVAEARAAAQAREQALAAELDAAAERLEAEVAAERARREHEIGDAGRREAERFVGVPSERIAELAPFVVARIIGDGGRA